MRRSTGRSRSDTKSGTVETEAQPNKDILSGRYPHFLCSGSRLSSGIHRLTIFRALSLYREFDSARLWRKKLRSTPLCDDPSTYSRVLLTYVVYNNARTGVWSVLDTNVDIICNCKPPSPWFLSRMVPHLFGTTHRDSCLYGGAGTPNAYRCNGSKRMQHVLACSRCSSSRQ
jgi:hypothetical protein